MSVDDFDQSAVDEAVAIIMSIPKAAQAFSAGERLATTLALQEAGIEDAAHIVLTANFGRGGGEK